MRHMDRTGRVFGDYELKPGDYELKPAINVFDTFSEYAFAVKALCDFLQISQEDIVVFPFIDSLDTTEHPSYIKFIRKIPVHINIPPVMSPQKGGPYIRVLAAQPPNSDSRGSPTQDSLSGLIENELISPYQYGERKPHIRYWEWRGSREYYPISSWCFFIRKEDYFEFAKAILRLQRKEVIEKIEMPILPASVIKEIYKNTIEFLHRGQSNREQYKKHHIPYKRGLLFCGPPGCGKTLTCKWLRQLCIKHKLAYKIVTTEVYRRARDRGNLKQLFKLPNDKRGIIFFDDMDQAVKSRESGNNEISSFLTALDGIESTEGVVYIFTTNYIKDLDEAFVRPGRIDVFMPFAKPTRQLRRIFVDKMFQKELKDAMNVDELLDKTSEYTFAEIEEIRKLLCLALIDGKPISIESTFELFDKHRREFEGRARFGFGKELSDEDDKETEEWWDGECEDAEFS